MADKQTSLENITENKSGILQEDRSMKNIVVTSGEGFEERAMKLADKLKVQYMENITEDYTGLQLKLDDKGLALISDGMDMRGDFTRMLPRLKKNNLNGEMLVKASKISGAVMPLTIIDATAGMGEDSLLLAAAGFKVILFERDSVIAALLKDTLERSADIPELSEIVARMELHEGDSIKAMNEENLKADVILLDPMFPERQKSGLVKKKFQLLHHLENPCTDEEELLAAAMKVKPRRIVIKRPMKGPYLADVKPSYSINGKAVRYDCIAIS